MKKILSVVIFLSFSMPLLAQTNQEETKAITSMLRQQEIAWNQGNIPAFMQSYLPGEDLKFIGKNGITQGWKATLNRYLSAYPDRASMGQLAFDLLEIQQEGNMAWVLGHWQLTRPEKGDVGGHFTLLLRKVKGQWLIVRDHTS